jgi:acyl-CoA reductase-like NAD-dependent aldehyde dehydrogenase
MQAIKRDLFINGEWMKAQQYTSLTSPYSEEVIGEIPSATEAEVDLGKAVVEEKGLNLRLRK